MSLEPGFCQLCEDNVSAFGAKSRHRCESYGANPCGMCAIVHFHCHGKMPFSDPPYTRLRRYRGGIWLRSRRFECSCGSGDSFCCLLGLPGVSLAASEVGERCFQYGSCVGSHPSWTRPWSRPWSRPSLRPHCPIVRRTSSGSRPATADGELDGDAGDLSLSCLKSFFQSHADYDCHDDRLPCDLLCLIEARLGIELKALVSPRGARDCHSRQCPEKTLWASAARGSQPALHRRPCQEA